MTQRSSGKATSNPNFLPSLFSKVDLEAHLISHDRDLQRLLDRYKIGWGVQWEIHRGLKRGIWSVQEVLDKIDHLEGTNAEIMHRVSNIMKGSTLRQGVSDLIG